MYKMLATAPACTIDHTSEVMNNYSMICCDLCSLTLSVATATASATTSASAPASAPATTPWRCSLDPVMAWVSLRISAWARLSALLFAWCSLWACLEAPVGRLGSWMLCVFASCGTISLPAASRDGIVSAATSLLVAATSLLVATTLLLVATTLLPVAITLLSVANTTLLVATAPLLGATLLVATTHRGVLLVAMLLPVAHTLMLNNMGAATLYVATTLVVVKPTSAPLVATTVVVASIGTPRAIMVPAATGTPAWRAVTLAPVPSAGGGFALVDKVLIRATWRQRGAG